MGDSNDFMDWAIRSEALDPEEDPMQDLVIENPSSTTQVPLNQGSATRYCEGFTDGYKYAVDQALSSINTSVPMLPYGEGGSARLVQGPIGAAVWPHDNPDPVLFSNSVDDATIGCTVSAANEIPADKSASCLGSFNPGSDAAIPRHNNADVESFLNDVYGPFHSGGNITMDPSSASIAEYSDDIMHGGSLGFDFEGAMHEQSNVDGCGADLSFSGAIDPGLFHESAWPFQTTAVTPFQSAATVSVGPDTTQSQSPNGCQGQIVYAAKQSESNNQ